MPRKINVLFLCTGNSCRSQMAEGWARALKGDVLDAYSAGIEPHGLNPRAVRVMAETGVDISGHRSKTIADLHGVDFDVVITVCGHANERCPVFPDKTKVIHVGFDDPPALAKNAKSEEEALSHYRRVRDEIRRFIENLRLEERGSLHLGKARVGNTQSAKDIALLAKGPGPEGASPDGAPITDGAPPNRTGFGGPDNW